MTHAALRFETALCDDAHIVAVRISGDGCRALLGRIVPTNPRLADGQIRATLLLDEHAEIRADLHIARDDDAYYLLAEGISGPDLVEAVRGVDVDIEPLNETHSMLSVHGPYAWELLAEVVGPDILSMPYLSLLRGAMPTFRIGKTGEYGYHVLTRRAEHAAVRDRIREVGVRFGLGAIDLETLDDAALESGFFVMRREGRLVRDPVELQQQWRLSYEKDHASAIALRAKRHASRRTTTVTSAEPLRVGDAVYFADQQLGEIVSAMRSPWLDRWVALSILDRRYAHAGVDRYHARRGDLRAPLVTVNPPLLRNRSLFVRPQRHSYHTRTTDTFPGIV